MNSKSIAIIMRIFYFILDSTIQLIHSRQLSHVFYVTLENKVILLIFYVILENIIEREYRGLKKIKDSYNKSLISMDEISLKNNDGIEHFSAWDVL